MYSEYFGLKELPFSIAPDPRYLYMSEQHWEALAHLIYGIKSNGGVVLLTGEIGTGKTTVCRCLLEQIPEDTDIAFILNPKVTVEELLATICDELEIVYPEGTTSIKVLVDRINAYLLDAHAKGRKTVLIIEEAQNLSIDVLEQVRLLTNLETRERKLLQIIMVGQPELRDILLLPELRQLSQRITARYHLGPLSKNEIAHYVKHRLWVAGLNTQLFPSKIVNKLYSSSNGIPRQINLICDRALLGTYVQGKNRVDKSTLARAADEVLGERREYETKRRSPAWAIVFLLLVICGVALAATYYNQEILNIVPATPEPVEGEDIGERKAVIEPAGTVKLDTLQLLAELTHNRTEERAYQALFNRWGVTYNRKEHGKPCQFALERDLSCLMGKGSLATLRQLNRPAVLKFLDEQGSEFYATLTALSEETASFVLGDETWTVAVEEVVLRWFGEYTLVWRKPQQYTGYILPNSKGSGVQWLDKQLAIIFNRSPQKKKEQVFDAGLVSEIKNIQLNAGLVPDGVVGPQTLILINTVTGGDMPLLTEGEGEG